MSLMEEFDHYNIPMDANGTPISYIEKLRDEALETETEVGWSEKYGGFWVPASWDVTKEIFRNPTVFSNREVTFPSWGLPDGRPLMLAGYNPPAHTKYRRVLQEPFSPGSAGAMADYFRQDTNYLIDKFIDKGDVDLTEVLAGQIPGRMTAMICGLPPENGEIYRSWTHSMTQGAVRGDSEAENHIAAFKAQFYELLEDRRRSPGNDIMSMVINNAQVDERPLTEEELMDFFAIILIGAIDNTAYFMGDVLWRLAWDVELRQRLIENPALTEIAIDEFMRYYSTNGTARYVEQDVEIGGVRMKEGDHIFIEGLLVNRDPRQFVHPDAFIPNRSPNRHLALGLGIHRCIGAHLIRVETTVVIQEFLKRIPEYELHPTKKMTWIAGQAGGVTSLPVVFEPGSPRAA